MKLTGGEGRAMVQARIRAPRRAASLVAARSLSWCSPHPEEIAAKARRPGRNSTPYPGLTTGGRKTRLTSRVAGLVMACRDTVSDPACHGACSKGQAPRHASGLERRDAFEEGAGLALTTYG